MKRIIIIITLSLFFYSTIYATSQQLPIQNPDQDIEKRIYEALKKKFPGTSIVKGSPEMIRMVETDPDMINLYKKKIIVLPRLYGPLKEEKKSLQKEKKRN